MTINQVSEKTLNGSLSLIKKKIFSWSIRNIEMIQLITYRKKTLSRSIRNIGMIHFYG